MNKSSTMDAPEGAPQSVSAYEWEQARHRLEKRMSSSFSLAGTATCDGPSPTRTSRMSFASAADLSHGLTLECESVGLFPSLVGSTTARNSYARRFAKRMDSGGRGGTSHPDVLVHAHRVVAVQVADHGVVPGRHVDREHQRGARCHRRSPVSPTLVMPLASSSKRFGSPSNPTIGKSAAMVSVARTTNS